MAIGEWGKVRAGDDGSGCLRPRESGGGAKSARGRVHIFLGQLGWVPQRL